MTEYAVVDHGRNMAASGAGSFAAWTVVFGNPAAGAKLLHLDMAAAVDIPLLTGGCRYWSQGVSEIVLRAMRSFAA